MPAKVRKIAIEGFRGALRPVELDFGRECRSLVLYGDNGTGKSTFADALEWFFHAKIEHLAREGCKDSAYRHRLLPDSKEATVQVVFDDLAYWGCRRLDAQRTPAFDCVDPVREFVARAAQDIFILRHGDMRNFVDKTKTEKLSYIANIIGLEKLSAQRDHFASAVRQLKNDSACRTAQANIKTYQTDLKNRCGGRKFEASRCYTTADQLRVALGGAIAIVDSATLAQSTQAVLALRSADNRETLAAQLRAQQGQLVPARTYLGICDEMAALESAVRALQADKRAVDEKALAELYRAGQQVLDRQAGATDSCPLCGQPVDQGDLYRRLSEELGLIRAVQERMEELRRQRADLRRRLDGWQVWAARVAAATFDAGITEPAALAAAAQAVADLATGWAAVVGGDGDGLQPVPAVLAQERALAAGLVEACVTAHLQLEERLAKLAVSTQEQENQRQYTQLEAINQNMQALARAERTVAIFERQIQVMEAVAKRFEKLERDALQQVLDAISADVNAFYCKLHPEEGFDHVRLCPTDNRGLEFEFSYHGETVSPPGKLLSESHLNTLGVCLFLAAARHFNRSLRFLVLDDIVNSVDVKHRQVLGRMLRDDFADVQILLLTHDDVWFETMTRLTKSIWQNKRISGWAYDTGFWIDGAFPDLDAEIRELVRAGRADLAGNKARKWFEHRLKRFCYKLHIPLPFLYNDENEDREVGKLLPLVRKYMEETTVGAQHAVIFNDLEANQYVSNLLSHDSYIASASPQGSDIILLLDDIKRLESLVTCQRCKKMLPKRSYCRCQPPFNWS